MVVVVVGGQDCEEIINADKHLLSQEMITTLRIMLTMELGHIAFMRRINILVKLC